MALIIALVLFSGLYVGWSLGANDGANAMGTAVGSGVRTVREAIVLVSVFGFLGAVLFGQRVIKTIGNGIVPLDAIPEQTALTIAIAAMLATGTWLTVATYLGMPVSTTHSAVGAVAGAGLAAGGVPVYWGRLVDVVVAWLATPIGSIVLGYVTYVIVRTLLKRFPPKTDKPIRWALTASGIFMAFAWGANDVANATGVIVGIGLLSPFWATVIGGLAIAVGISTWGYKVMQTVGYRITHLAPPMALAAELASALNVQVYTLLGVPVSTTHSVVGAILGVGLVHGRGTIDMKTARDIVLAWTGTPVLSGAVAAGFFLVIRALLPG